MTAFDRGTIYGACLLGVVLLFAWTAYHLIRWWLEDRSWERSQRSSNLPRVVAMRSHRR